jgi:hypothetical protein
LFLRLIMWDCLIWHAGVTRQRDLTSLICVREVPKRVPNPARFWLVRHQERGMWSAKNEITINLICKKWNHRKLKNQDEILSAHRWALLPTTIVGSKKSKRWAVDRTVKAI